MDQNLFLILILILISLGFVYSTKAKPIYYLLAGLLTIYPLYLLWGAVRSLLFAFGLFHYSDWPRFLDGDWFGMTVIGLILLIGGRILLFGGPQRQTQVVQVTLSLLIVAALGLSLFGLLRSDQVLREGGLAWSMLLIVYRMMLHYRTETVGSTF